MWREGLLDERHPIAKACIYNGNRHPVSYHSGHLAAEPRGRRRENPHLKRYPCVIGSPAIVRGSPCSLPPWVRSDSGMRNRVSGGISGRRDALSDKSNVNGADGEGTCEDEGE